MPVKNHVKEDVTNAGTITNEINPKISGRRLNERLLTPLRLRLIKVNSANCAEDLLPMQTSNTRPIKQLLTESKLNNLISRAEKLQRLDQRFKQLLPPILAPQVTVANYSAGKVVLQVTHSAWATRLKFLTPEILARCQQEVGLRSISTLEVIIRPTVHKPKMSGGLKGKREARKSSTAKEALTNAAQDISDPELSAALKNLAASAGFDN